MSHCRSEHNENRDNVRCLNESEIESGKNVIKPWNERNDTAKVLLLLQFVESDSDEQLILLIPFTGSVKLKSIFIKSDSGEDCPRLLKVYINREDIDFDNVESFTATQEWELIQTNDVAEYQTRITKMYNVRNITLYFQENYGGETTKLFYVGFKGEWTEIKKDHVITLYEAAPNPADHKKSINDNMNLTIEDFKNIGKIPCARDSFLYGVSGGIGVGAFKYYLQKLSNWAFGAFSLIAIGSWETCRYKKAKEFKNIKVILKQRKNQQSEETQ
nr:15822_t:CDS:10 [Entrophospora candida]